MSPGVNATRKDPRMLVVDLERATRRDGMGMGGLFETVAARDSFGVISWGQEACGRGNLLPGYSAEGLAFIREILSELASLNVMFR